MFSREGSPLFDRLSDPESFLRKRDIDEGIDMNSNINGYFAVIDMGSNGIRLSITDLSPPNTRSLPCVYECRSGISLYDAQHLDEDQGPIPEEIIDRVVDTLQDFKQTCESYAVDAKRLRVVATEATRTAQNSQHFLERIQQGTGWVINLLSKEEEGKFGAWGIASSVNYAFSALVLDMGGGSVQLTWMEKDSDGNIQLGPTRSFPYGAASLTTKLKSVKDEQDRGHLLQSISSELEKYFQDLQTFRTGSRGLSPGAGYPLLLSGGGFRRWGHFLMTTERIQPYPIPIINGYTITGSCLFSSVQGEDTTGAAQSHRISTRGISQLPAVRLLLQALHKALPTPITTVTFSQGGVREGLLFSYIPAHIRTHNALSDMPTSNPPPSKARICESIRSALPSTPSNANHHLLIPALANTLNAFLAYPKDIRPSAALRCTTTGVLASAYGPSHFDRAILALVLCERHGGADAIPDIDRPFLAALQRLVSPSDVWWARYIGRVAKGVAEMCRAGVVPDPPAFGVSAVYDEGDAASGGGDGAGAGAGAGGCVRVAVEVFRKEDLRTAMEWARDLHKLGKKGGWVEDGDGGRWGVKVDVSVRDTNGNLVSVGKDR